MSNLLDKASIILTPTAYNNGEALCVKPSDGSGDFDFSRNSAATRVNAQGLVENVQILSSNLVQNGDFSEEGVQEVSNGSFSQEGVELVTNGSFDTDTNWTKQTGWSISGGSANCDGSNGSLYQSSVVEIGKSYICKFEITNITSGSVAINAGGNTTGVSRTSVGTYSEILQVTSGSNNRAYIISQGFNGSIDNVSVREVGQDWTLGTGWSVGEDKATVDNTVNASLDQTCLTSGKIYKVSFEISDLQVGGNITVGDIVTPSAYTATSNGLHTFYYTATNSTLRSRGKGYPCSITNISVKEVGQNWTLGTGWSIAEDKVVAVNGNSYGTFQGGVTQTNKKYKVTYTIEDYISGTVNLRMHTLNLQTRNSNGTFTEYFTSVGSSIYIQGGNNFNGSITNISVIEITDDTNLPRINYEGFSYDGSGNIVPDSGCGSWLFESQSTNLIPYSSDYTNGWINTGTTDVISSTMLSPNGLDYSTLLVGDVATASTKRIRNTVTPIASTAHTFSVFVKSANRTYIQIINSGDAQGYANFDVSNGIVGNTGSKTTSNITPLNNNWYRCEVSTDATTINGGFMIYLVDSNTASFAASGTSTDGVYIWGAMLEQGNISSYIPTEGSTVTRNQDVCTNGGSLASINSTEGTLYFEGLFLSDGFKFVSLNSGSSANRVSIYSSSQSLISYNVRNSNGNQMNGNFSVNSTIYHKIALKYKENDFSFWVDGVKVATDNNGTTFLTDTLNELSFNDGGSTPFYGKTKAVAVWKEALSDQELAELTTI